MINKKNRSNNIEITFIRKNSTQNSNYIYTHIFVILRGEKDEEIKQWKENRGKEKVHILT